MFDIHEILKRLPHRYPFLLVDRVLEIEPGVSCVAIKNVTMNEPQFQGHWPENPMMPGVLVLEAIFQAGAIPLLGDAPGNRLVMITGIQDTRFKRSALPGDQIIITVQVERGKTIRGVTVCKGHGTAKVGDALICEGYFTCAVTEMQSKDPQGV